jgi:hypothetical protein
VLWIGLKGDVICEENLVLILGQAQNDRRYHSQPDCVILDAMDPVELGICAPNHSIPITRIAFALASQNPGVTPVMPTLRRMIDTGSKDPQSERSKFTPYDFWFAGVDPSTFGCVTAKEAGHYQDLLASSRLLYNPPFPVPRNLGNLDKVKALRGETMDTGEARVNMRRAANSMRMALKPHFPHTWHHLLFEGEEEGG